MRSSSLPDIDIDVESARRLEVYDRIWWVADLLAACDRLDEALSWAQRAMDAGNTEALRWAAE
ncbi:hypothetical protein, partial [Streptomyces griseorubiginosus]|uniref:hypothetical protein n=1 Tax=Streptomyces griseorubiginosus TaxID=67304 RepID=UPI00344A4556